MDGHYDREADVAWLRFDGWSKDSVAVERTPSGLIERDRATGRIVGLEYWDARRRLPEELLEALPSPPARNVVFEREPA